MQNKDSIALPEHEHFLRRMLERAPSMLAY